MQGNPTLHEELGKINPDQPYGTELFNDLARLMPIIGLEAVCLRQNSDQIEVFLTKRESTDPAYPGEWHAPGTILRLKEDFETAFKRLSAKELGGAVLATKRFVGYFSNTQEVRGHALSMIHVCTLDHEPPVPNGGWFPVTSLPEPMVDVHRNEIIPMAIAAFTGRKVWKT